MAITCHFHGHATLSFDTGKDRILVDPFFTSNPVSDISADDVQADFILITHGHFDHVEDLVSVAKRTGAKLIANYEIAAWLKQQEVPEDQVHAQHIGDGLQHDFGHVKLVMAQHGSGLPDGSDGGVAAGLILTLESKKVYIAG